MWGHVSLLGGVGREPVGRGHPLILPLIYIIQVTSRVPIHKSIRPRNEVIMMKPMMKL